MKIFGREPALIASFVTIVVANLGAFAFHWSTDTESLVNAVLLAGLGLLVAAVVHDGLSVAVVGLAKAALSLAVGLGWNLDAPRQALLMSLVTGAVTLWAHGTVTAPVGPDGSRI